MPTPRRPRHRGVYAIAFPVFRDWDVFPWPRGRPVWGPVAFHRCLQAVRIRTGRSLRELAGLAGKVIEAVKAHRARVRVTEEWVRRVRVPDRATLLRGLRRTVLEPQQRLRLESERRLYVIADRSGLTIVRGNVFARKRNALRPPHGWVVVALGERRKGPLQPIVTIAGENP